MRKTCTLTKCLPPSSGEMVHCFSSCWLSLQEAPGIRGMSYSLTQTPTPVAGTRGFQPHSRPEGLCFSTGLLQSWAPLALEINVNQWKLQEKVKYQQQKCLLCTSLFPLCFCQVTRSSEENRASKGWREKKKKKSKDCRTGRLKRGKVSNRKKLKHSTVQKCRMLSGEGQQAVLPRGPNEGHQYLWEFLSKVWYPGPWVLSTQDRIHLSGGGLH